MTGWLGKSVATWGFLIRDNKGQYAPRRLELTIIPKMSDRGHDERITGKVPNQDRFQRRRDMPSISRRRFLVSGLSFSFVPCTFAATSSALDSQEKPLKQMVQLSGHKAEVTSIAFSPDGKFLVSIDVDARVIARELANLKDPWQSWNYTSGKPVDARIGFDKQRNDLIIFSPNRRRGLKVYSLGAPEQKQGDDQPSRKDLQFNHQSGLSSFHPDTFLSFNSIAFSKHGWFVAYGFAEGGPYMVQGELPPFLIVEHRHDGRLVIGESIEKSVKYHEINALEFSSDAKLLAIGGKKESSDSGLAIVTAIEGQKVKLLHGPVRTNTSVNTIAFPTDASFVAIGLAYPGRKRKTPYENIKILSVDGKKQHSFTCFDGDVSALTFSPDSKYLFAAGKAPDIHIFRCSDWQLTDKLKGHEGPVTTMVKSHDGRWLATGSEDQKVILWSLV